MSLVNLIAAMVSAVLTGVVASVTLGDEGLAIVITLILATLITTLHGAVDAIVTQLKDR